MPDLLPINQSRPQFKNDLKIRFSLVNKCAVYFGPHEGMGFVPDEQEPVAVSVQTPHSGSFTLVKQPVCSFVRNWMLVKPLPLSGPAGMSVPSGPVGRTTCFSLS